MLAILGALGCDGAVADPTEIWCNALCTAEHRCGVPSAPGSCVTRCRQQRPGLKSYSAVGAEALAPCVSRLSCLAFEGEQAWETTMQACWQEAQLSVAVTDRDQLFCDGYALSWFECGYHSGVEDCRRRYAMWADRVVERLALCVDAPTCEALERCDGEVWNTL